MGYEVTLASNFHSGEYSNSQEKTDAFTSVVSEICFRVSKIPLIGIRWLEYQLVDQKISISLTEKRS